MAKKMPLRVAGVVFSLVALMHLLRLIDHTEITVGAYHVPMWVSVIGLVVGFLLAFWMFRASKRLL